MLSMCSGPFPLLPLSTLVALLPLCTLVPCSNATRELLCSPCVRLPLCHHSGNAPNALVPWLPLGTLTAQLALCTLAQVHADEILLRAQLQLSLDEVDDGGIVDLDDLHDNPYLAELKRGRAAQPPAVSSRSGDDVCGGGDKGAADLSGRLNDLFNNELFNKATGKRAGRRRRSS